MNEMCYACSVVISIKLFQESKRGLWADASTLGFAPGVWPTMIQVAETGLQYRQGKPVQQDGEIVSYRYETSDGRSIIVFND